MRKVALWLIAYFSIVFPYFLFEFFLMFFFKKNVTTWDFVKGGLWGSGVFFISILCGYIFSSRKENISEKFKINLDAYKPKRSKYKNK